MITLKSFAQMRAVFLLFIMACTIIPVSAQNWKRKKNVPNGTRTGAVGFALNNKVYVGGGTEKKDFWEFDPATDTWNRKEDIPGVASHRAFAVGFAVNGKGYISCGLDNATMLKDLWEYDAATDAWTQKADLPSDERYEAFAFVIGNKAYVGAGSGSGAGAPVDMWEYDASNNVWSKKTDCPEAVMGTSMFSVGGKGYISCGYSLSGGGGPSNFTHEYDPMLNKWSRKSDFPGTIRNNGLAFGFGNIAYVGLGVNYPYLTPDLFRYDPANDTWESAGNFIGGGRLDGIAITMGSKAYIGTGTSVNVLSDWWELSAATGTDDKDPAIAAIRLYPNPAKSWVIIEAIGIHTSLSCTLYSSIGQKVLSQSLQSNRKIDISQLPQGIYTLEIQSPAFVTHRPLYVE